MLGIEVNLAFSALAAPADIAADVKLPPTPKVQSTKVDATMSSRTALLSELAPNEIVEDTDAHSRLFDTLTLL